MNASIPQEAAPVGVLVSLATAAGLSRALDISNARLVRAIEAGRIKPFGHTGSATLFRVDPEYLARYRAALKLVEPDHATLDTDAEPTTAELAASFPIHPLTPGPNN